MEKNNDNEKKYFDLDELLKPDENINLYDQKIPSKGKLQRMLLAGYFALRWIDSKIDNITDFIENITAVRNESEKIIGLPYTENDYEIILGAAKLFSDTNMIIEATIANSFDASKIDGYCIQAKLIDGLRIVWKFDVNKKYLSKKIFTGDTEYTGKVIEQKEIEKLIPLLVKAGYILKRVSGADVNGGSGYRYIFEYKTDSNDKIDIFTNEDGEIE